MGFDLTLIQSLCHKYGPQIHTPPGVDGARLLFALSGNESGFGRNCTPRHEPAYDAGGVYGRGAVMTPLLAQFGSAAACSYGPWQVMYCNCTDWTPADLEADAEACAQATVAYLNSYVLGSKRAQTVAQIAEIYNSGSIHAQPAEGVLRYITSLCHYYAAAVSSL